MQKLLYMRVQLTSECFYRSSHAASQGWCVAHSLVQTSTGCSAAGSADQCSSNSLCFVRGEEEESLDKWYSVSCMYLLQLDVLQEPPLDPPCALPALEDVLIGCAAYHWLRDVFCAYHGYELRLSQKIAHQDLWDSFNH